MRRPDRHGRITLLLDALPGEAAPQPAGGGIETFLIYPAPVSPLPRPASSRTIAAAKAKAAAHERNAAAALALRAQVQKGFRVPAGRVFSVDVAALLIIGPAGALGTSPLVARTLEILAQGGRHAEADLVAAGWRDADSLREGLASMGPKLVALGLRVDRRRAGVRIGRVRSA